MDFNEIAMHTGIEPYIEQYGFNEQVRAASSICTRYTATSQSQLIIGEVEDLSNQAYATRQLRQPHQPTAMEVAEHRLTHMPSRSWCATCVKAKRQPNHHRIRVTGRGRSRSNH
eukprot:3040631-Amphidinium_carterae.3